MVADTILKNGNVLTMDQPRAREAVAIGNNGRILAVGSNDEIANLADSGTKIIYLHGQTLIPGFNDCHMHILPYGLDLGRADLTPQAGVRDVPSLCRALRLWADANPNSEWVEGSRYDQNTFPGAAHPTRQDLDAVFPDKPVYIRQTSGHASSCNSVALKLARVTRETANPPGGEIVRDASGEPTGVLLESAMDLVDDAIPEPSWTETVNAIERANQALVRVGITSASDLHTGWLDLETEIRAYIEATREGAPVRTTLFPHAPVFGEAWQIPLRSRFLNDWKAAPDGSIQNIRIGPLKLFSDGALTTRTAALREPYVDGSGSGMLLHEPGELDSLIHAGVSEDWQMAVHAIGDRAIELVLHCLQDAVDSSSPIGADTRHRIEHAMLLDDDLISRFKNQNVIPVIQPEFVAHLGDAYILGLGEERASRLNPTASLQRAGIGVPFSSDCPVVPGAPMDGIRAAVRRTTPSGRVLGPDERISARDAMRNYTYWAACSTFDELETGTISPGKRADLTVLSHDPSVDLDAAEVAATIIGGQIVYGNLD
jgi:predicted amidohydrolase YtcJ